MALPSDLAGWLAYQQAVHPQTIALGLERVRAVAQRLQLAKPAPLVITVAGTNGKGSTVAMLSAMLSSAGLTVGCYTSPHLLNYRERVQVRGALVAESALLHAFKQIEAARGAEPLTFFEYGTLAALLIFAHSKLDAVVLEVGLGGRLDATNIVDADAVILTTVGLDHQEYLGATRALIGVEKAGVFRNGQLAVYADREPEPSVLEVAKRLGTQLILPQRDYRYALSHGHWQWQWQQEAPIELPQLALRAPRQYDNAAAALALLCALSARQSDARLSRLDPRVAAKPLGAALAAVRVPARLQLLGRAPELWIDVAHNPQAAESLAEFLQAQPRAGRTLMVYGALSDKDALGVVSALRGMVRHWFIAGLSTVNTRGLSAEALRDRVAPGLDAPYSLHNEVAGAICAAQAQAQASDRIVIFGSFFLIAAALSALGYQQLPEP